MKTFAFACLLAASAVNAVSLGAEAETELGTEFGFALGGSSGGGFDIDGLIRKARTKINNKGSVSDDEEEEQLEKAFKLATEGNSSDSEGHTAIADLDFLAPSTSESESEEVDEDAVEELKNEIATGFDNVQ